MDALYALVYKAVIAVIDLYQAMSPIAFFLFVLGLWKLLVVLLGLFDVVIWRSIRPSRLNRYKEKNAYAVVTGCTDGLGKEFAVQLAKKGWNILAVSRTRSKLEALKAELGTIAPSVESEIAVVDFSNPDYTELDKVLKALNGPVTVLVNNVGATHKYPEKLLDASEEEMNYLVRMNVDSTNQMTYHTLPYMVPAKHSLILNLSSGASWFPHPMLNVYASTKEYINYFTEGINLEYARDGVHAESLSPLYVASKLSKMRPGFLVPKPAAYVRSALGRVGYQSAPHAGFMKHDLAQFIVSLLPKSFLMTKIFAFQKSIRVRALKRAERLAAEGQK